VFVGASAAVSDTTLVFSDDQHLDLRQSAATVIGGYAWPSRISVRAALGVLAGGSLEGEGRTFDLGVGLIASIGVARQWSRAPWFLTGSAGLGVSHASTREMLGGGMEGPRVSLTAIDARGGLTAGRTFGPFSPYLLARVFGGPLFWRWDGDATTGTDTRHFQLGAGASLAIGARAMILVDIAALGERAASLGVAVNL
jgi:hypothetical protein